jgi:hypothetical protein
MAPSFSSHRDSQSTIGYLNPIVGLGANNYNFARVGKCYTTKRISVSLDIERKQALPIFDLPALHNVKKIAHGSSFKVLKISLVIHVAPSFFLCAVNAK